MGNRVTVTLTVLKEHQAAAAAIFRDIDQPSSTYLETDYCHYEFTEVNYTQLDFEDALTEAGIPWDKQYEGSNEWTKGCESVRFDEYGCSHYWDIADGDEHPDINELLKRLNNYTDLVDYIKSHVREHTVMGWENQVEYAKRYLARQMISPDENKEVPMPF